MSTPPRTVDRRADAILLGLTVFWGVSFTLVKDALDDSDPFTFLACRFAVAGVVVAALAGHRMLVRALWRPGVTLGVFLFLGYLTQTWGLATTTPARSAFITGLFVIFVPFVGWALFRQRPGPTAFVSVALATLGLYWLTGANLSGGFSRGDALTLACALAYAVHMVLAERFAAQHPALPLAAVQVNVVAVLALAVLPFVDRHFAFNPSLAAAIVATGVISTAMATVLQMWTQARMSAVRAALIIAAEPVFATTWSIYRGRDTFEPHVLLGGALMVVAVGLSVRKV